MVRVLSRSKYGIQAYSCWLGKFLVPMEIRSHGLCHYISHVACLVGNGSYICFNENVWRGDNFFHSFTSSIVSIIFHCNVSIASKVLSYSYPIAWTMEPLFFFFVVNLKTETDELALLWCIFYAIRNLMAFMNMFGPFILLGLSSISFFISFRVQIYQFF